MHHSSEPNLEMDGIRKTLGLGATGRFPEGQLNQTDEGEIAFAVRIENSKIVLEFGKPVGWLGMDAKQAKALAEVLIEKAKQSRGDIRNALASQAKPRI